MKGEAHSAVQALARQVLAQIGASITPQDTEASIAARAVAMLAQLGVTRTWYHDCPALVLLGSRSCLSVSGRDYRPAAEPVGMTNLVTIDLSPLRDGIWGDCARSFYIEDGRCAVEPASAEFREGAAMLRLLHERLRGFVRRETTFDDLFAFANALIAAAGFENLDFRGNVGHSIASALDQRSYAEGGNARRLCDAGLFTFEPHIRKAGGRWGYKHENIYRCLPEGGVEEI